MDILLCDDHLLLLEAMAGLLVANGHRVVGTVTDLFTVVDSVVTLQPDVCIIDIGFPDGSGIDIVREISVRAPATKVLMLSASTDPAAIRRSFEAGALGFVRKDDSMGGVLAAIGRLMSGEIAIEPRLLQAAFSDVAAVQRKQTSTRLQGYMLTPRERDVLELLVAGASTTQIADELAIATSTARTHIQNVLVKTGVHTRLQAATLAVQQDLVSDRRGF